MAMRSGKKIRFLDNDGDSGSFIGYKVYPFNYGKPKRGEKRDYEAQVDLGDCQRRISWYIQANEKGIKKLNTAITVLEELRAKIERG